MQRYVRQLVICFSVLLGLTPVSVYAGSYDRIWNGGNANWDSANWNGSVPNDGPGVNVYIDNGNATNSTVTLTSTDRRFSNLYISASDELLINTGGAAVIFGASNGGGGRINNAGTINMNGTGYWVSAWGYSYADGGGVWNFNNNNNFHFGGGGDTFRNFDNTMQGWGTLILNNGSMYNRGTIKGNSASGAMIIDPGNFFQQEVNGQVIAEAGGTVQLNGGNYYDAVGTKYLAKTGSTIKINGAQWQSGSAPTFETEGTGEIQNISSSSVLRNFTVTSGSNLRATNNSNMNIFGVSQGGGTVTNNGTVTVDSGSGVIFSWGSTTVNGAWNFNSGSNLYFGGNDTLVNNGTFTATGTSNFGSNVGNITNNGTIKAEQSGGFLTLDTSGTFLNASTGVIQANNFTTVRINPSSTMTNNGSIQALDGGLVELNGGIWTNGSGSFTTTGGSTVRVISSIRFLGTNTNNGNMEVNSGLEFRTDSANFVNNGLMIFNPNSYLLNTFGTNTLSGTGILRLVNAYTTMGGNDTLVNASTHEIQGYGTIGSNVGPFNNQGTVNANAANETLIVNGSSFSNSGILKATVGGNLQLSDSFTNSGTVTADGGNVVLPSITITGGNVQALNNGEIKMTSAALSGNTTAVSGTGVLHAVSGTNSVSGTLTNTGTFKASGGAILNVNSNVSGTGGAWLADNGTININNGVDLTTTGDITIQNNGMLNLVAHANNATITGNDLTMDGSANSRLSVNSQITLSGNFSFEITDEADMTWGANSILQMNGGTGLSLSQINLWPTLEVGGTDSGTDPVNHVGAPAGFSNNFDLTKLIIGSDAHIKLVDTFNNGNRNGSGGAAEALYVDTLEFLDAGGRLNLNGLHLYYNNLIGNTSQIGLNVYNTVSGIHDNGTKLNLGIGPELEWDDITQDGDTGIVLGSVPQEVIDGGFTLLQIGGNPLFFDISTTATFSGEVSVTFDLSGITIPYGLSLDDVYGIHYIGLGNYEIVPGILNGNLLTFSSTSFSGFGVGVNPEPASLLLLLLSFGGWGFFRRSRNN